MAVRADVKKFTIYRINLDTFNAVVWRKYDYQSTEDITALVTKLNGFADKHNFDQTFVYAERQA